MKIYCKPNTSIRLKVLLAYLSIFYFSCGSNDKSGTEHADAGGYFLEKVDSIYINHENKLSLLDFHPGNNRFLAFDQITEEFLVLDNRGKALEAVYRKGEGPNEYNSNLLGVSFNQEDEGYYTLSSTDFLWFDSNWEIKKRLRFMPDAHVVFYSGPRFKVPYYTLAGTENPYFFANFFTDTNSGIAEEARPPYLIQLYHPKKDSLEWTLPNQPELLPEFELDKEDRLAKPVPLFVLDNDAKRMYLTYQRSGEIGIYDLTTDFKLEKKFAFQQESFVQSNNSRNLRLFNFSNNTFGILYYKGLSEAATLARKNKNPDYYPYADPSLFRMILIRDGVQEEKEIEFPENSDPNAEIVQLPGNRILLRDKYLGDDEPDYSTYSVFEVKPAL
jgi:hypothetical protein